MYTYKNLHMETLQSTLVWSILFCSLLQCNDCNKKKEWQEVIPQTASKNNTEAKDNPALPLQTMCMMAKSTEREMLCSTEG